MKHARKVSGQKIVLEVPLDIVDKTSADAARLQLTPTQHQGILAAFINVSGGDINEFPLSDSTLRRDRKIAAKRKRKEIKDEFKESVSDKHLIVHFDGKLMNELTSSLDTKVKKKKKNRMAVLVTSPELVQIEQLLGIPELVDGKGRTEKNSTVELLKEWEAWDPTVGVVFDTTASNTGCNQGSVTLLEKEKKRALIKMPCRRHVIELHAVHIATTVSVNKPLVLETNFS